MTNHGFSVEKSRSETQVEVSHASASDKSNIYYPTPQTGNRLCLLFDILLLLVVMTTAVLAALLWFDEIPRFMSLFHEHKNKRVVMMVMVSSLTGLSILLVVRVMVRILQSRQRTYVSSLRRTSPENHQRSMLDDSRASILEDDDLLLPPDLGRRGLTTPISELPASDLADVQQIFMNFIACHDEKDWCVKSGRGVVPNGVLKKGTVQAPSHVISIKMVLVGAPNVGKTSIFHRILYNRFSEVYVATLGADLGHTNMHIFPRDADNHVQVNIQLWDMAGGENFSELSRIIYKDADAFVIIDDVINPDPVTETSWAEDILEVVFQPYIATLLNKIDLDPCPVADNRLANPNDDEVVRDTFKVSAKTGQNLMDSLVDVIIRSTLNQIDKFII